MRFYSKQEKNAKIVHIVHCSHLSNTGVIVNQSGNHNDSLIQPILKPWCLPRTCRTVEKSTLNAFKNHAEQRKSHTKGLILLESLPSLFIASRIQARSTTAGTPVKSWKRKQFTTHPPNLDKEKKKKQTNHTYPKNKSYSHCLILYLQQHTSRLERDLHLLRSSVLPVNDLLHILGRHLELITVPDRRLEQNLNRVRKLLCNKITISAPKDHQTTKNIKITHQFLDRWEPASCSTFRIHHRQASRAASRCSRRNS